MNFIRKNSYWATLVISFAITLIGFAVYFFLINGIFGFKASVADLSINLSGTRQKQFQALRAKGIFKNYADEIKSLNSYYVDISEPLQFIMYLENLAQKSSNSLSIDTEEASNASGLLGFRLTVDGSQASVIRFIRLLELAPYIIKIQTVTYQKYTQQNLAINQQLSTLQGRVVARGVLPTSRMIVVIQIATSQ